jgi:O-antigen/teichoic acid export membrane protein
VLTPIYVGLLSAKVYGVFTKMYSWTAILTAIISFGMETTFFRYINKNEHDKDMVYCNTFIGIALTCGIFLLVVFSGISGIAFWLNDGNKESLADYIFYIRCLSLVLVIDALCAIPFAYMRTVNKALRYSSIKFLNIFLVVTLNLTFLFLIPYLINHHLSGSNYLVKWYRPHWVGYIFLANLLSSIITFLILIPEIIKFRFKFDGRIFLEMIHYSWPILIANISYIINENLDKIMLGKLLPPTISEQEVGIYGACAKIALFLSLFVQAFRLGAEPFFFSQATKENSRATYAKIMDYFVIVVSIICVAIVANIEVLKYFIKGHDVIQQNIYWSGLGVVPLLLFGYMSLGIYMNLSVWFKLSDQTKYGLYITGIAAILTVVLNFIFIPKYSYMASAWISFVAYATMMVLAYFWGQKNYPIPYNVKKNVLYILFSGLLVYLSFSVFKRNLIIGNLLLISFVGSTIYFERKNLASMLKIKRTEAA